MGWTGALGIVMVMSQERYTFTDRASDGTLEGEKERKKERKKEERKKERKKRKEKQHFRPGIFLNGI